MSKYRIGLYPGTFDPITNGHIDIVKRGLRLVDKLIIGVATNPSKNPMFSLEERVEMVERELKPLAEEVGVDFEVQQFDELLMHFAEKVNATVIIRGLRAVADFEYEFQMTGMNYQINPNIETLFLMADPRYQTIASKLVKEVALYGGEIAPFVPATIAEAVRAKIADAK
ncbi:pantetheine-phosphate adenylyltransferase [Kordiimonas sp. SCSIO 12610]|uniref:pantetheine-phosphate adenylyltransferase n=1 Tax=Kordiimonas sp. SCSIO 12610 TaxID=2829597 RepID=UPI00210E8A80|nr:pantetheine-phosphate adenylyltransferase [Kordiimonas sp. SCSIO 12610]UTW53931.1 pantetheine-phosphate adenylyltransferase [Kordiimonas sp. SCSIO 12610]